MEIRKHSDCRNFVTVDVAKGLCRRTGQLIPVDTETCGGFTPVAKCRNCAHYGPADEKLGTCEAERSRPWTYPELVAVTCGMYAPKQ
ncbi:MAG: 4-hydroxyphenylacetate decarboxylase small subunit [Betaproteobacteria bacterium]